LRLSSTKLYLIASNESNSNQISVWSVLDQQSFFKDYDMIGETECNEILFSLPIGKYYYLIVIANNIMLLLLFKRLLKYYSVSIVIYHKFNLSVS